MQPDFVNKPEVQELTTETRSLVALVSNFSVATAEQYTDAGEHLKRVKGAKDRLEKLRKSMTSPLDQAKKAIMDFFRGPSDQLDQAESRIKRGMIAFTEEQDRLRREEQARADEKARKEKEALEARAKKAEQSGKVEKAAELEQQAAAVVAPVVTRDPPRVIGTSIREAWKFEITNEMDLPREFLVPDESKIRRVVQAMKGDTKIPGVRVWAEKQLASGTA